MFPALKGDIVKIHYIGKLASGEIFDRSPEDRPLQFIIGKKEVIPGMEQAVLGMVRGEKRTVTVPADQAYGEKLAGNIAEVDRSVFPAKVELKVGARLQITQHDGSELVVEVVALNDTKVTIDANHPLAGKELIFDIDMLDVQRTPQSNIFDHFMQKQ